MERRGPGNPNITNYSFKPGQTGNPAGRPKKLKLPPLDEVLGNVLNQADANGKTKAEMVLDKLMELALKGDVRAAEMLLDRGYGKPKQSLEVAGEIHTTPMIAMTLPVGMNISLPSNTEGFDDAEIVDDDDPESKDNDDDN